MKTATILIEKVSNGAKVTFSNLFNPDNGEYYDESRVYEFDENLKGLETLLDDVLETLNQEIPGKYEKEIQIIRILHLVLHGSKHECEEDCKLCRTRKLLDELEEMG